MTMELRERTYSVTNEGGWVRDYNVRYAGGGWFRIEVEDTGARSETFKGYRSERDAERDAARMMETAAENARADCARTECHTDGADDGNGNFACGVLAEHGIHVHVSEDGCDVTQDYYINGA